MLGLIATIQICHTKAIGCFFYTQMIIAIFDGATITVKSTVPLAPTVARAKEMRFPNTIVVALAFRLKCIFALLLHTTLAIGAIIV